MTSAANVVQRYKLARFQVTLPRQDQLPDGARGKEPITPEGTDLAIWTWEKDGKIYGIAFQGKGNKALWRYQFRSEAGRQRQIEETAARRRLVLKEKADKTQERRDYVHPYKVGDIFYTSWGYNQTNVDFYEVVEVKGKVLKLREIGGKLDHATKGADYVVPDPGKFEGPAFTVKPVSKDGVKIDGHMGWPWKGKAVYQTESGAGH